MDRQNNQSFHTSQQKSMESPITSSCNENHNETQATNSNYHQVSEQTSGSRSNIQSIDNQQAQSSDLSINNAIPQKKNAQEGIFYQQMLLTWFQHSSWRLRLKNFRLASEDLKAGKFDDVVFEFDDDALQNENDAHRYVCIQAKHTTKGHSISLSHLLGTRHRKQFDIKVYLNSVLVDLPSMISNPNAHFVICTNYGMDEEVKKVMDLYDFQSPNIQQMFNELNGNIRRFNVQKMEQHSEFKGLLELLRTECSKTLQNERIDEQIKTFFERFVLVTDTKNEAELAEECMKQHRATRGTVESRFINFNVVYLMYQKFKEADSTGIAQSSVTCYLDFIKLKSSCTKMRTESEQLLMNLKQECLENTQLYTSLQFIRNGKERFANKEYSYHAMEAEQILRLFFAQNDVEGEYLIMDKTKLENDWETLIQVYRYGDFSLVLVIVCDESKELEVITLKELKISANAQTRQRMLITLNQSIETQSERFHVSDLNEKGKKVLEEKGRLFGTDVVLRSLVEDKDDFRYWVKLAEMCDRIREQPTLNQKGFQDEEATYITRWFISNHNEEYGDSIQFNSEELGLDTRSYYEDRTIFKEKCESPNKKVIAILNGPGCGKTTFLKWLATDLEAKSPDSLTVHFSSIRYSQDFELLMKIPLKKDNCMKELDAIRILFRFIYLLFNVEDVFLSKQQDIKRVRDHAIICSNTIVNHNDRITLNTEQSLDLPFESLALLRLFLTKLDQEKLIVLFDAFDEISPTYTELALNLLVALQQCEGIKQLFITSRPHGFEDVFKTEFNDIEVLKLTALSDEDMQAYCRKFVYIHDCFKSLPEHIRSTVAEHISSILDTSSNNIFKAPLFLKLGLIYIASEVQVQVVESFLKSGKLREKMGLLSSQALLIAFFINTSFEIERTDKQGKSEVASHIPANQLEDEENVKKQKQILCLMAVASDENLIEHLSDEEKQKIEKYKNEFSEGKHKPGLIERFYDHKPKFIHKTIQEYFSISWLVENRKRNKLITDKFLVLLYNSFDNEKFLCTILNSIAIEHTRDIPEIFKILFELQEEKAIEMYEQDRGVIQKRDMFGRTPLHLAVCMRNLFGKVFTGELSLTHFLEKVLEMEGVEAFNVKDHYGFSVWDLGSLFSKSNFTWKWMLKGAAICYDNVKKIDSNFKLTDLFDSHKIIVFEEYLCNVEGKLLQELFFNLYLVNKDIHVPKYKKKLLDGKFYHLVDIWPLDYQRSRYLCFLIDKSECIGKKRKIESADGRRHFFTRFQESSSNEKIRAMVLLTTDEYGSNKLSKCGYDISKFLDNQFNFHFEKTVIYRPIGLEKDLRRQFDDLGLEYEDWLYEKDQRVFCRKYIESHELFQNLSMDDRLMVSELISDVVTNSSNDYRRSPMFLYLGLEYLSTEVQREISAKDLNSLLEKGRFETRMNSPWNKLLLFEHIVDRSIELDCIDEQIDIEVASGSSACQTKDKENVKNVKEMYCLLAVESKKDFRDLLTDGEKDNIEQYAAECMARKEKPALIERFYGVPEFIHNVITEYLLAVWIFENRARNNKVRDRFSHLFYGFYGKYHYRIKMILNTLSIQNTPGIDNIYTKLATESEEEVLKLYEADRTVIKRRDIFGRTPLHFAFCVSSWINGYERHTLCCNFLEIVLQNEGVEAFNEKEETFGLSVWELAVLNDQYDFVRSWMLKGAAICLSRLRCIRDCSYVFRKFESKQFVMCVDQACKIEHYVLQELFSEFETVEENTSVEISNVNLPDTKRMFHLVDIWKVEFNNKKGFLYFLIDNADFIGERRRVEGLKDKKINIYTRFKDNPSEQEIRVMIFFTHERKDGDKTLADFGNNVSKYLNNQFNFNFEERFTYRLSSLEKVFISKFTELELRYKERLDSNDQQVFCRKYIESHELFKNFSKEVRLRVIEMISQVVTNLSNDCLESPLLLYLGLDYLSTEVHKGILAKGLIFILENNHYEKRMNTPINNLLLFRHIVNRSIELDCTADQVNTNEASSNSTNPPQNEENVTTMKEMYCLMAMESKKDLRDLLTDDERDKIEQYSAYCLKYLKKPPLINRLYCVPKFIDDRIVAYLSALYLFENRNRKKKFRDRFVKYLYRDDYMAQFLNLFLLESNLNTDKIFIALANEPEEVLKLFAEDRTVIKRKDMLGRTPMHFAICLRGFLNCNERDKLYLNFLESVLQNKGVDTFYEKEGTFGLSVWDVAVLNGQYDFVHSWMLKGAAICLSKINEIKHCDYVFNDFDKKRILMCVDQPHNIEKYVIKQLFKRFLFSGNTSFIKLSVELSDTKQKFHLVDTWHNRNYSINGECICFLIDNVQLIGFRRRIRDEKGTFSTHFIYDNFQGLLNIFMPPRNFKRISKQEIRALFLYLEDDKNILINIKNREEVHDYLKRKISMLFDQFKTSDS